MWFIIVIILGMVFWNSFWSWLFGKPGGMMTKYRTRDGRTDYGFLFERQGDGSYRIYILSQPGYGSRASDNHSTHRLRDGNRYYVCWNAPIQTLDDAKTVAALWADKTQEYIRAGAQF